MARAEDPGGIFLAGINSDGGKKREICGLNRYDDNSGEREFKPLTLRSVLLGKILERTLGGKRSIR